MAHRPGGLDPEDIQAAVGALGAARSIDDIERAIDAHPVIQLPAFHGYMRQEYVRLHNQKSPHLQNFLAIYDDLFMLLHYLAHEKMCAAVEPREPGSMSIPSVLAAPHWLSGIIDVLEDRLPAMKGPTWNPATDYDGLLEELAEIAGGEVDVPAYEAADGVRWNAVTVVCPACRHPRLTMHAYAVDLRQAPHIERQLREGGLDAASCPHCGVLIAYPGRVWIQEEPGPLDALSCLTSIWRVSDRLIVFRPPPGFMRDEANDRILEIRLDGIKRRIGWEDDSGDEEAEVIAMSYSVAYSREELIGILDSVQSDVSDLPMEMEIMISDYSRKLRAGEMPLYDAEAQLYELVPRLGAAWPVRLPTSPADFPGDAYEYLVVSLIAEGVLEAKKQTPDLCAIAARSTVAGYIALDEKGLAEAALARAEDFLAAVPEDNLLRENVEMILEEARLDLSHELGAPSDAQAFRDKVRQSGVLAGDSFEARLTRLRLKSEEGLTLYESGQYMAALDIFPETVEALRNLLAEARQANEETIRQQEVGVMYSLSAALANWAALLMDFGVNDDAERLLVEALDLSEAVKAWEFAGIQSHRLVILYNEKGRGREAEEAAQKAIRYAARVGDHTRIWTTQAFLAEQALNRRDGPAAMALIGAAAEQKMQERVGLGYHVRRDPAMETLADGAFQAIEKGGEATTAIMIAESLKAATMASALATGMPLAGSLGQANPEIAEHVDRLKTLVQKREALRLKAIWDPDDPTLAEDEAKIEEELDREQHALGLRDARFGRWIDATDVRVSEARSVLRRMRQLGERATFMGVLPYADIVWTYAFWNGGSIVASHPWPGREGRALNALPELSRVLIAPLDDRLSDLGPGDRLVISLHDQCYDIPFGALPWRGRPLGMQVDISYVQGIGVLEACLDRPTHPLDSILCIGDPARPDTDPLAGAREEVRQIENLFTAGLKKNLVLLSNKATVGALKSDSADYDVLHFACHATTGQDEVEGASLMLAPDLRSGDSGVLSEDRILTEIIVRQGGLVNLAGCATGFQRSKNAPLMGGLVPAFLAAGAGSVVGSLWPIADAPAARFQTAFYHGLIAGERPADSLARVQRACMTGELGEEMRNPEIWAAFVVYGRG